MTEGDVRQCSDDFKGLIQHSFALRLGEAHEPFDDRSIRKSIEERFALDPSSGHGFRVKTLEELGDSDGAERLARHSPLTESELTTVRARRLDFLAQEGERQHRGSRGWPGSLAWAMPKVSGGNGDQRSPRGRLWPRMYFAEFEEEYEHVSKNDFLIEASESNGPRDQVGDVARALLEAIAFRRSQLFGLATANRFVSVMLPNAVLEHRGDGDRAGGRKPTKPRDLLLQPLLSLVRDGRDRKQFRHMYSLAFFVIPIEQNGKSARSMSVDEVVSSVNAGWSLADTVPEAAVPQYVLSREPLWEYVRRLVAPEPQKFRDLLNSDRGLSLRQVSEIVAFGIALRMTRGSTGEVSASSRRRVGDDVVTSLGTARVSAAILIDPKLKPYEIKEPIVYRNPPGSLDCLIGKLSSEARTPKWTATTRRRYQLDRPFIDGADYAIGLVPSDRCLLIPNVGEAERDSPESLLSRVAAVTYMTLGAATAIGTMRSIDRSLERLEHEDPRKIAEIEAEIATDLHEIYDLDIARETYRQLYGRLRDRIGITQDYETLQNKMQTLYSATSTFHDDREQKQLAWLTAAIVALSLLTLIGTIVVASK